MTTLTDLKLAELRDGLAKKEFSSRDVTDAYLGRIEKAGALNTFIRVTPEIARQQADEADARIAKGEARALEQRKPPRAVWWK